MVICEICKQEYRVIKTAHLTNHGITREEYKLKYPNSMLFSEETKRLNSEISKKLWKDESWASKCKENIKKSKTPEYLEKQSKRFKKMHNDGKFAHIYTKERNKKISEKKIEWWNAHPEEKERVSKLWIEVKNKMGEDNWKKELQKRNLRNIQKNKSSFQEKFEEILNENHIKFIAEYKIDDRFFDIYLPNKNILIELDGDFWHKTELTECKYDFQIYNYYNDRLKDKIAKDNDIELIRIKHSDFKKYLNERKIEL